MIRLAMMLLGVRHLGHDWVRILAFGATVLAVGLAIVIDASDFKTWMVLESFGWIFVILGVLQTTYSIVSRGSAGSPLNRISGGMSLVAGLAICDFPIQVDIAVPVLFGIALLVNGAFQIGSAWVIRFPGWRFTLAAGLITVLLGGLCFLEWREAEKWAVPLLVGVTLIAWGGNAMYMAVEFRRFAHTIQLDADSEALRYFLHHFISPRYLQWITGREAVESVVRSTSSLVPERPSRFEAKREQPIAVHVWTPTGSVEVPGETSNQLVSRYIAAVDGAGKVSSGHAALELPPDLYVSHYPKAEITVEAGDVVDDLRAKDQEGFFFADHASEIASWMPPNVTVRFHHYNGGAVRRFWRFYGQSSTYNLTNRNCSVAVALALDVALTGALERERPLFTVVRLLLDADFWAAAFIRKKATEMVWTPGLALDYALAMRNVLGKYHAA